MWVWKGFVMLWCLQVIGQTMPQNMMHTHWSSARHVQAKQTQMYMCMHTYIHGCINIYLNMHTA